jgi:preprotein translocase subunit Sec61beta
MILTSAQYAIPNPILRSSLRPKNASLRLHTQSGHKKPGAGIIAKFEEEDEEKTRKNPSITPSNAFACSPLVRVVMLNAMAVSFLPCHGSFSFPSSLSPSLRQQKKYASSCKIHTCLPFFPPLPPPSRRELSLPPSGFRPEMSKKSG